VVGFEVSNHLVSRSRELFCKLVLPVQTNENQYWIAKLIAAHRRGRRVQIDAVSHVITIQILMLRSL
jgi:hypothetical protein